MAKIPARFAKLIGAIDTTRTTICRKDGTKTSALAFGKTDKALASNLLALMVTDFGTKFVINSLGKLAKTGDIFRLGTAGDGQVDAKLAEKLTASLNRVEEVLAGVPSKTTAKAKPIKVAKTAPKATRVKTKAAEPTPETKPTKAKKIKAKPAAEPKALKKSKTVKAAPSKTKKAKAPENVIDIKTAKKPKTNPTVETPVKAAPDFSFG